LKKIERRQRILPKEQLAAQADRRDRRAPPGFRAD
jgi:hypothetical protein